MFMTCWVTKAMPIYFINGKCYIKVSYKATEKWKSRETCYPTIHGLYHIISCHWLLLPSVVDTQTDRHTYWHDNQNNFNKPDAHFSQSVPGLISYYVTSASKYIHLHLMCIFKSSICCGRHEHFQKFVES